MRVFVFDSHQMEMAHRDNCIGLNIFNCLFHIRILS